VQSLAELGADVIGLGVPFSDPMADGPTIQRSSQRALANCMTLKDVIELAAEFRRSNDTPIVLFSYLNPILRMGFDDFAVAVADAGIDGVLVTDAVDDEATELSDRFAARHIDLISLVAPTTTEKGSKPFASVRGDLFTPCRVRA
jgi:tryptophan synthase alpha chain